MKDLNYGEIREVIGHLPESYQTAIIRTTMELPDIDRWTIGTLIYAATTATYVNHVDIDIMVKRYNNLD